MSYCYQVPKNLIPRVFLLKRHVYARKLIGERKRILDVGSNRYKILARAVSLDKDPRVFPDYVGDALNMPFPNESFDCLSALEIIEHWKRKDQIRFLNEAWRVLVPGGLLVLSTPNISEATRKLHDLAWFVTHSMYARQDLGQHIGEVTHRELKKLITSNGFALRSEKAFSLVNYVVSSDKI